MFSSDKTTSIMQGVAAIKIETDGSYVQLSGVSFLQIVVETISPQVKYCSYRYVFQLIFIPKEVWPLPRAYRLPRK